MTLNEVNSDSILYTKPVFIKFQRYRGVQSGLDDFIQPHSRISCHQGRAQDRKVRYVARISSKAHGTVVKKAYQSEFLFLHYYYHVDGCKSSHRHVAYTRICDFSVILHCDNINNIIKEGNMCV